MTNTENKSKSLTRIDLIERMHKEIGLSQSLCTDLLDSLLKEIKKTIRYNNVLKVRNFGSFYNKHKNARIGRNPKTKEEYQISARNVVTFHVSKNIKEKINQND